MAIGSIIHRELAPGLDKLIDDPSNSPTVDDNSDEDFDPDPDFEGEGVQPRK